MVSLLITLDTGHSASVVRTGSVPWLSFGPEDDVEWQIDQYTQEAIATVLALDGWEPFAEDRSAVSRSSDGLAHSAIYTVRNLSSPVVTWNDLR